MEVHFHLVSTRMPGDIYRRRFRSLLSYLCHVFRQRLLFPFQLCVFNTQMYCGRTILSGISSVQTDTVCLDLPQIRQTQLVLNCLGTDRHSFFWICLGTDGRGFSGFASVPTDTVFLDLPRYRQTQFFWICLGTDRRDFSGFASVQTDTVFSLFWICLGTDRHSFSGFARYRQTRLV